MADHLARARGAVRPAGVARRADLRDGRLLQRRPRDADEAIAPIRALGEPVFDLLREQPYTRAAVLPRRHRAEGPALLLADRVRWPSSATACSTTLRELRRRVPDPGRRSSASCTSAARSTSTTPDDGAVGNRDARYACGVIGALGARRARRRRVPRTGCATPASACGRSRTGGNYVNFQTADEGEDRVRASYGANYDRLVRDQARVRSRQPVPLEPQRPPGGRMTRSRPSTASTSRSATASTTSPTSANWPEYWPGLVRVEPGSRWREPGDVTRIVDPAARPRGAARDDAPPRRAVPRCVEYTSTQPGLPDVRHERHFDDAGDGCTTGSSSSTSPRGRAVLRPPAGAPRRSPARCAGRSRTSTRCSATIRYPDGERKPGGLGSNARLR